MIDFLKLNGQIIREILERWNNTTITTVLLSFHRPPCLGHHSQLTVSHNIALTLLTGHQEEHLA